jgi:hypothetical protein
LQPHEQDLVNRSCQIYHGGGAATTSQARTAAIPENRRDRFLKAEGKLFLGKVEVKGFFL